MGAFFFRIYEFLFTLSNPPPVIHRPRVPERYTIKFVPAASTPAFSVSPVMSPRAVFVPAELPPRYAIKFVPAVNASVSADTTSSVLASSSVSSVNFAVPSHFSVSTSVPPVVPFGSVSSTEYSIVSSAVFAVPSSSSCIGPIQ